MTSVGRSATLDGHETSSRGQPKAAEATRSQSGRSDRRRAERRSRSVIPDRGRLPVARCKPSVHETPKPQPWCWGFAVGGAGARSPYGGCGLQRRCPHGRSQRCGRGISRAHREVRPAGWPAGSREASGQAPAAPMQCRHGWSPGVPGWRSGVLAPVRGRSRSRRCRIRRVTHQARATTAYAPIVMSGLGPPPDNWAYMSLAFSRLVGDAYRQVTAGGERRSDGVIHRSRTVKCTNVWYGIFLDHVPAFGTWRGV